MDYRGRHFPAPPRARVRRPLGCMAVLVPLLIVLAFGFSVVNALHVTNETCTVEDKDRTTNRDGQSDARIYTEDCGVLQTQDSLLSWHFSSSDVYASIDKGKTYEFKMRGFRIPFFSMFPNVVEIKEVKSE